MCSIYGRPAQQMRTLYFAVVVTYFLFSSPILSGRRLHVYHAWCGLSANLECMSENVLHAARWKYSTQKLRKKLPSAHHRTSLLGYIFVTKAHIDNRKKVLNSNISSTWLHNMVNVGPTAEIGSGVWDTRANFNGFRVLASLLHRRRSVEVNQTFHDVWPFPALVHYTLYIHFWGLLPLTEFCQVQNSLCIQVSRSAILAASLHGTRAVGVSQTLWRGTRSGITELSLLVIFNRGRHLYSEGGHHVGHRPTF